MNKPSAGLDGSARPVEGTTEIVIDKDRALFVLDSLIDQAVSKLEEAGINALEKGRYPAVREEVIRAGIELVVLADLCDKMGGHELGESRVAKALEELERRDQRLPDVVKSYLQKPPKPISPDDYYMGS